MKQKKRDMILALASSMAMAQLAAGTIGTARTIKYPLAHLRDDEQRMKLAAEKRERRKERNGRNIKRMEAGRQKYLNRKMGIA